MDRGIIVTKTPLRISFAGGGTDFSAFYEKDFGAVLSSAIDKYVYVTVKRHHKIFSEPIRLDYSESELVDEISDIKNDIARECLRFLKVDPPIYISTIADIPAASGLGSSSSFCVGLLHALHVFRGEQVSEGQLGEEASHIEIDLLKRPIGKQDQYVAAYGGFNFICFMPDGGVSVETQRFPDGELSRFFGHLMLFWTGITRDARSVLEEQRQKTAINAAELTFMRDHAVQLQMILRKGFDPLVVGNLLNETWQCKRKLASQISNTPIDQWYESGIKAGAFGGKLCGAGGGGFLLFVVPPEKRDQVRSALSDLLELVINYEPQGTRLLTH